MGNNLRNWLRRGLLVFGLVCLMVVVYRTIENAGGEEAYDHAAEIAFHSGTVATQPPTEATEGEKETVWVPVAVEDDEHMTLLRQIDLNALKEVNPDVVGWIYVPDTDINYPVLQGEDNDFYLKHTWEKVPNGMGSIFLETKNTPDFTDFNTIVYGHNMNNGSMFADLGKFSSAPFLKTHPYVYIVNGDGVFRYEVFSYYQTAVDGFVYGLSFNQVETRRNFVDSALDAAYYDIGVEPALTDRILTLSTCSGGTHAKRWVVLARLEMEKVEQ